MIKIMTYHAMTRNHNQFSSVSFEIEDKMEECISFAGERRKKEEVLELTISSSINGGGGGGVVAIRVSPCRRTICQCSGGNVPDSRGGHCKYVIVTLRG